MSDDNYDYTSPPMGPGRKMLLVDPDKYAALKAERDALAAKVEELEAFTAGCVFAGGELRGRVENYRALAQTLTTVLEDLEWEEELNPKSKLKYCPVCLRYSDYGHEDDCKLDAALALAAASGVVPGKG